MTEKKRFGSIDEAFQFMAHEIAVTQRAIRILAHAMDIAGALDVNAYADALDLPDEDEAFRERLAAFAQSLRVEPDGWTPTVIEGGKGDQ